MIPKKIHYCWFGLKPYPKIVIKCMETWKRNFPDYEFYLWNESNSPMDVPFVKQAYEAKKFAFVADYVRFWALYEYGGIYLDTDMYVTRNMDTLLNNDFFSAYHSCENTYINFGVVGATQRCSIIEKLLEKYHSVEFSTEKLRTFVIPHLLTPLFNDSTDCKIVIYPYDYFYAFPYEQRETRNFMKFVTPNSYAIHLWSLSWVSPFEKVIGSGVKYVKKVTDIVKRKTDTEK